MIALSDQQRTVILEAADRVPGRWRSRFIENCIDRLLPLRTVSDTDLSEAIHHVAARLHVNLAEEPLR